MQADRKWVQIPVQVGAGGDIFRQYLPDSDNLSDLEKKVCILYQKISIVFNTLRVVYSDPQASLKVKPQHPPMIIKRKEYSHLVQEISVTGGPPIRLAPPHLRSFS